MYLNKCTKCGAEFETKNPKRVICPGCLYPDRNPIPLKSYSETINPQQEKSEASETAAQKEDQSNKGPFPNAGVQRRPYNDGNRENFHGGGYRPQQGGDFRRPPQGGYNQQGGDFRRPQQGGYGQQGNGFRRPPQGGYNQQGGYGQQGNGFRRPPQGGYNQQGGFAPQGGGFRRPPQGGFASQGGGFRRPPQGGYNQQGGGFRRPPQGGGFNNARPAARKSLLISREQVAQIETIYVKMLPLPNPDAHEVIGKEINLEPNKVFFGMNLVRQKMRLPKMPYPKRKLALTPDQITAIENLYAPLLPLPPIGCHKFIAKQLKMDEWRVHVGIGIIRKQLSLPRWNAERDDAPEEFKQQKQAEQVEQTTQED
ncbi:MAG: hypothetical protein PHC34_05370 [Candidatus Gastranaerophilales bacterium]|nr:hypothetical protein [Candidatus Gastranaerophilales bacterium]